MNELTMAVVTMAQVYAQVREARLLEAIRLASTDRVALAVAELHSFLIDRGADLEPEHEESLNEALRTLYRVLAAGGEA